jgi:hypothetical protein
MDKAEFNFLIEQTGLTLTDAQKAELFGAYPLFQAMVAKATPDMAREIEPSSMFTPEVK